MKLGHISAVCRSLENADRFYKKILNLEAVKDFSIDRGLTGKIFGQECGCRIIVYANDEFRIEVFIPEAEPFPHNPFSHHCLEVSGKDEFLNRCQLAGLKVNFIPKGDKTLTFVSDFDGNLYEITEIQ